MDKKVYFKAVNNRLKNMIMAFGKDNSVNEEEGREPIKDGITDPTLYTKAPVKILFILKEAYNNSKDQKDKIGEGGWDHCKEMLGEGVDITQNHTHRVVSKVTTAILRGYNNHGYNNLSEEEKIEDFQSIAWINVGKYPAPGVTETSKARLKWSYNYWKPILYLQIESFDPDIIYFGGTFSEFINDIKDEIEQTDDRWPNPYPYIDGKSRLLLEAYHPAATEMTEDDLVESVLKRIRENQFRNKGNLNWIK